MATMPNQAVQQLLEQGERSGLFSAAAAADALAQTPGDGEPLTTAQVAEQLIEKKVLTAYQAEQLLAGRAEQCSLAGRYRILEKLGEGGMGTVYKAHDTQLDRDVAVKVLPAQRLNDADAVARFQREARALARLSHPHIVQAYDNGVDQGRHFLVMEYVEGASLAAVLREQGAVTPTLAADMIYQAALGLQHAHEKGLVHRDVKPANLLLCGLQPLAGSRPSAGNQRPLEATTSFVSPAPLSKGIVKILDLGLARFLLDQLDDSQLTREGTGVGTPDYMAPEQFRDTLHVDARTDIYGLGCTLYQMISGTVPFPGSSFHEKAQAHVNKEPIPLEERCPEVPAGLALLVSKMMAKHPADRFQTADEVAEALAPYIAGASHSAILLKQTMRFHAGQLTVRDPDGRKRSLVWAGGVVAAACLAVFLTIAWPRIFGSRPGQAPDVSQPQVAPRAKPQVVSIENGLTVAKDGTGQYTTISEALDKIQPGQTIRVLDRADYPEQIQLSQKSRFAQITLESTMSARLIGPEGKNALIITNVPGVTIRGFRFSGAASGNIATVAVVGMSQGTLLEKLVIESGYGIFLWGISAGEQDAPVIVQDCTISAEDAQGIRISGVENDNQAAKLCRRVVVRNNSITGARYGIVVAGLAQQVHLVGNRVCGCRVAGVILTNLLPETKEILIANNSLFENGQALTLLDDAAKKAAQNVRVSNNLILTSLEPDFVFQDGLDPDRLKGPGDGAALREAWQFSHNWREVKEPAAENALHRAWIPIGPEDVRQDKIEVLSRDQMNADFLRPERSSPLAAAGAGGDLPGYVGAIAPEGVAPWDWQWTWDALIQNRITVSQKFEDGGRFRTINDALKAAGPRMTVRVLDDAVYAESFSLTRATQHEGLTLEAVRRATIAPAKANIAVGIFNVPRVTLRGFRLRAEAEGVFLVAVIGQSPSALLEKLEMDKKESISWYRGIAIEQGDAAADATPVVVQDCTIQRSISGIRISGMREDYTSSQPISRVIVRNNRLVEPSVGIILIGTVRNVLLAGNRINGASLSAIQLENLLPGTDNILIANNSILESTHALRLRDDVSRGEFGSKVRIHNNLVLDANGPDMLFVDNGGDRLVDKGSGDGLALHTKWTLSHNWREIKIATDKFGKDWIPPSAEDAPITDQIDGISRDARHADFGRPAQDSQLASSGAGGDLPSYVGAVPPQGAEAWDWDKTWKAMTRPSE